MVTSRILRTSLASLALGAVLVVAACSDNDPQHSASDRAVKAPTNDLSFADYVKSTRQQIHDVLSTERFAKEEEPFGGYNIDQVVDMRAPFAIEPDDISCDKVGRDLAHGENVGFLMIHGLTDSPFWLSDVRDHLRKQFPCASFHGVLLPGHGTVPGDLMNVKFDDWLATVRYGVDAFGEEIEHIIPIGYSMGAALIGRDFDARQRDDRISGMIMLSPGLTAKSEQAWLTPYARHVTKWVGQGKNNDPAKYGSMAMNAAAEFHLLTEPYRDGSVKNFDIPVFLVISSDDQTVDPLLAVDFFCQKVQSETKHLIWYQGENKDIDGHPKCDAIDIVSSANDEMRTINHAHTAITMHPENPVYGVNGKVRDCGHYDEAEQHASCQTGQDTVYGERNLVGSATPGTLRRGTFNPDFPGMSDKMSRFILAALGVETDILAE